MVVERNLSGRSSEQFIARNLQGRLIEEVDLSLTLEVIRAHNLILPRSMTLIADGNLRWAKQHGLPPAAGHIAGTEAIKKMLEGLSSFPEIETITIWALSPDNISKRDPEEVGRIMEIITENLKSTIDEVVKRNGRIVHLGEKEGLPKGLVEALTNAEKKTSQNTGQRIVLAVNYNGRQEMLGMVQRAVEEARKDPNLVVDKEYMMRILDILGLGESDLVFRTGGDQRTSGFGWRIEYAEEITVDNFLPDLTDRDLAHVLLEFAFRDRRFGGRPEKTAS